MVASPVDPLFGGALLHDATRVGFAAVDHRGVRHVFVPAADGVPYALDIERKDALLEPETVSILGAIAPDAPALLTWTRIEVLAKLTDVPAHLVMRNVARHGWNVQIETRHPPHETYWISIGRMG
mgnify:CR=1 FL=1|tara:strand:+ start:6301 stop:6675 length:375 start_codon:yes stop_codon:yes gene_type:complete